MIAPAHQYNPETQTGIQWNSTSVTLYWRENGGIQSDTKGHTITSAYDFWHSCAFLDLWPDVTHWWAGDAWTGNVRFSPPVFDDGSAKGYIQFGHEDNQSLPYEITPNLVVDCPLPPFFNIPSNIVLRRQLAEIVLSPIITILEDRHDRFDLRESCYFEVSDIQPDTWIGVTSLVEAQDVELLFPVEQPRYLLPPFHRGNIPTWREVFCRSQGLYS